MVIVDCLREGLFRTRAEFTSTPSMYSSYPVIEHPPTFTGSSHYTVKEFVVLDKYLGELIPLTSSHENTVLTAEYSLLPLKLYV